MLLRSVPNTLISPIMFLRAVAACSLMLHLAVSLLGHYGLHALMGDSHCPSAVHASAEDSAVSPTGRPTTVGSAGPCENPVAASEACHGHAHRHACRSTADRHNGRETSDLLGTVATDGSRPAENHHHAPDDEHTCDICSVISQALLAPTAVDSGICFPLSQNQPLPADAAFVAFSERRHETRGPPAC